MALEVIGAGLGRTGTLSLKLALEKLGFGPCYHMLEIVSAGPDRVDQWVDVVRGNPDWNQIFEGFRSTVDYPACNYWRELADHNPDAKIILSTRDAQGWFASVNKTIFAPERIENFLQSPLAEFIEGALLKDFDGRTNDQAFMVDFFKEWEASVIAQAPPERLLVHRPADGWEPLCAFLGVEVPTEAYPRVNTSDDMAATGMTKKVAGSPDDAKAGARGYIEAMRRKAFGT